MSAHSSSLTKKRLYYLLALLVFTFSIAISPLSPWADWLYSRFSIKSSGDASADSQNQLASKRTSESSKRARVNASHQKDELKYFYLPGMTFENVSLLEAIRQLENQYFEVCKNTGERPIRFKIDIEGEPLFIHSLKLHSHALDRSIQLLAGAAGMHVVIDQAELKFTEIASDGMLRKVEMSHHSNLLDLLEEKLRAELREEENHGKSLEEIFSQLTGLDPAAFSIEKHQLDAAHTPINVKVKYDNIEVSSFDLMSEQNYQQAYAEKYGSTEGISLEAMIADFYEKNIDDIISIAPTVKNINFTINADQRGMQVIENLMQNEFSKNSTFAGQYSQLATIPADQMELINQISSHTDSSGNITLSPEQRRQIISDILLAESEGVSFQDTPFRLMGANNDSKELDGASPISVPSATSSDANEEAWTGHKMQISNQPYGFYQQQNIQVEINELQPDSEPDDVQITSTKIEFSALTPNGGTAVNITKKDNGDFVVTMNTTHRSNLAGDMNNTPHGWPMKTFTLPGDEEKQVQADDW
ncbi:hypothetical protein [Persicirhabdus sediminis]|uniref:Uncharacterized protein n=1 Tax=Persicirhabdus sediminis TaxID=454144 RepID=A0A8J7SJJ4_9BACT|nr:hypothetical protein [Persicirhabdus sediminis]MBK1792195.1 hypothetical protein [Persicirhabdus sediminis]